MDEDAFLKSQADECRRAAGGLPPGPERRGLEQLARHYDREARQSNARPSGHNPLHPNR